MTAKQLRMFKVYLHKKKPFGAEASPALQWYVYAKGKTTFLTLLVFSPGAAAL